MGNLHCQVTLQTFCSFCQTMRDGQHEDCGMVTIGNGCKGISVYYHGKEDKDKLHVPWRDIVKISYKNDKFRLIYHPPVVSVQWELVHVQWDLVHVQWDLVHVQWDLVHVQWDLVHVQWDLVHVQWNLVHV